MLKTSPTSRLIITIVATILLPIVVYSVYEITAIKEGEEVMERIYKDQLDAILFSANQYSDDAINEALDKLEVQLGPTLDVGGINMSFLQYSNFKAFHLQRIDSSLSAVLILDWKVKNVNWENVAVEYSQKYSQVIDQLIRYKESNYRKVEPKVHLYTESNKIQIIYAILEDQEGNQVIMTGFLDIDGFVNDVLSPKLQQIAGEELVVLLQDGTNSQIIYATDSLSKEISIAKPMWIFPKVSMGISSRNKSIKELVNERTQSNLIAAFVLILLLVVGFTLIVRNLNREMQLAQTKSDFVSNVSHEIRTPLSLISMFAETLMLDRVPNPEKRKEYEQIIFKETNRLTNIVNKILNFSQIESGNRSYHPTEINLDVLTEELIHDYAFHLEQNDFTYEFDKGWVTNIMADREAIYEALVNLIDNAIKYSDERRHIIFRTGQRQQQVYVEIQDQGIGISNDQVQQIFDKFYRVSEGNVHTRKGAGLGLALVHHIMNAHEGDIEVDSKIGSGSTFRLVFKRMYNDENTYS